MSNLIHPYYENAQLSDAAYADLAAGMIRREYEDALIARGFSSLQAAEFANRYSIVSTFNDSGTGFSATLFQRIGTNEKILAIRGTNDVVDFFDFQPSDWPPRHGKSVFVSQHLLYATHR